MEKKRIEWIDCYKGLLIILVVYGHFCQHIKVQSSVSLMFTTFFMAAFFLISGYVSSTNISRGGVLNVCINRCTRLLIPSLILTPLMLAECNGGFSGIFANGLNIPYWFTVTLFEIYVLFAIVCFLFQNKTMIFLIIMTISQIIHIIFILKKPDIYSGLSSIMMIGYVVHYIPYFFFGALMKMYNERFLKFIGNNVVMSIMFPLWIVGMIGVLYIDKFFHLYWTLPILSTIGVMCLFRLFMTFSVTFSSQTTVGRFMIVLGQNSLQIYLLHWFLLKELQKIDWSCMLIITDSTIVMEIVLVGIISAIIACLCILIDRFLRPFPLVHSLLLGFDWRGKKD